MHGMRVYPGYFGVADYESDLIFERLSTLVFHHLLWNYKSKTLMDYECGLLGGGYMVEGGINWNQSYCTQIMLCVKYNIVHVCMACLQICV